MKTLHTFTLAIAVTLGLSGAASASTQVIGNTAAASCFRYAEAQNYAVSALETCKTALKMENLSLRDRAATHVNRGIIAAGLGREGQALNDYNEAIRLQPVIGESYANRGVLYRTQKHYENAMADFNQALSLGVKRPQLVYFNRAVVLEETGDVKAAYLDYRKAADLDPDWALPRRELERFTVKQDS